MDGGVVGGSAGFGPGHAGFELGLPDVADDAVNLVGGQAGYRGHIAEKPVMHRHAILHRRVKGRIGVMVGEVHLVEQRRPQVGAGGAGAVALGAVGVKQFPAREDLRGAEFLDLKSWPAGAREYLWVRGWDPECLRSRRRPLRPRLQPGGKTISTGVTVRSWGRVDGETQLILASRFPPSRERRVSGWGSLAPLRGSRLRGNDGFLGWGSLAEKPLNKSLPP